VIFASDLDQTLIYSRKSFHLPDISNVQVRLVETLDGKEISFMTENAIKLLREITKKTSFVPVTTRTIEQYKRISIFQEEIIPTFAVTSNGGNILFQGIRDKEWSHMIKQKLDSECQSIEKVYEEIHHFSSPLWVQNMKIADGLFIYLIVDQENIPYEALAHFTQELEQLGWNHSLQGRKLYFVPKPVNKWDAVQFIQHKLGAKAVFTSGDSLLDLCMLINSTYSMAPCHGELEGSHELHIERTQQKGILSSEEILSKVWERLNLVWCVNPES
jgi:hydroxymethylpyrimidine pyrophosphatase-like HAD family hydrolase